MSRWLISLVSVVASLGCELQTGGLGSGVVPTGVESDTETTGRHGDASESTTGGSSSTPDGTGTMMTATATASDESASCPAGTLGCPCASSECEGDLFCEDEVCAEAVCGDLRVEGAEECDDANSDPFDGCTEQCTISAGARRIALGSEHACALYHSGQVKCWGRFDNGRLGYPGLADHLGDDESPAALDFVDLGAPVVELALGGAHGCVRHDNGDVRCWGQGNNGRLGQGDQATIGDDEAPGSVPPVELGGVTVQLAVGGSHSCALLDTGDIRCWGRNNRGQLGAGTSGPIGEHEVPAAVDVVNVGGTVTQIAAGHDHTCALLDDGSVRCWGQNNEGQLGRGNTDDLGVSQIPAAEPVVPLPGPAEGIVCGRNHSCVLLTTGELLCWGQGGSGRLGYGDVESIGDNEAINSVTPLGFGSPIVELAAGNDHTCARLADESILCWGGGQFGQLGRGSSDDQLAPPRVSIDTGVAGEGSGLAAGGAFTCLRYVDGQVKCWGRNHRGQLGYGPAFTGNLGDNETLDSAGTLSLE